MKIPEIHMNKIKEEDVTYNNFQIVQVYMYLQK